MMIWPKTVRVNAAPPTPKTTSMIVSVSDPNVGRVEYAYDDVGNLVERVDALGQIQGIQKGPLLDRHVSHRAKQVHGDQEQDDPSEFVFWRHMVSLGLFLEVLNRPWD